MIADAAPPPSGWTCEAEECERTLSGDDLLTLADKLVSAGRYDEAQPYLEALRAAKVSPAEVAFLSGYVASQTGDFSRAEQAFRAALAKAPGMIRARLELARVLEATQQPQNADYHYRLAQSADLPPDVAKAVELSRRLLRDRSRTGFDVSLGIAPDTNPTSATAAEVIDLHLGGQTLQAGLEPEARARPDVGLLAAASGRLRTPFTETSASVVEGHLRSVVFAQRGAYQMAANVAGGVEYRALPQLRLAALAEVGLHQQSDTTSVTSLGVRSSAEWLAKRSALVVNARAVDLKAREAPSIEGKELSVGLAAYRAISPQSSAALRLQTVHRTARDPSLEGQEHLVGVEWSRELSRGLTASASAERATFRAKAANPILGTNPRRDQRLALRFTLSSRAFTWRGFSPALTYSLTKNRSNLALHSYRRQRLSLELTRLF